MPAKTFVPEQKLALNCSLLFDNIDLSNFKLDSDNLNDCVAALLKKTKEDAQGERDIKRRQRKNKE